MPPAARIGDPHVCPMVTGVVPHVGGPIALGCFTVLTGGPPQARIGDMCVCTGPPDSIALGCFTVIVGGMPAARMGDMTVHGGNIVMGLPTVLIGDGGGGGGGGGGAGALAARMGLEGGAADQAAAAKVMIDAAEEGLPFCEQCSKT